VEMGGACSRDSGLRIHFAPIFAACGGKDGSKNSFLGEL